MHIIEFLIFPMKFGVFSGIFTFEHLPRFSPLHSSYLLLNKHRRRHKVYFVVFLELPIISHNLLIVFAQNVEKFNDLQLTFCLAPSPFVTFKQFALLTEAGLPLFILRQKKCYLAVSVNFPTPY